MNVAPIAFNRTLTDSPTPNEATKPESTIHRTEDSLSSHQKNVLNSQSPEAAPKPQLEAGTATAKNFRRAVSPGGSSMAGLQRGLESSFEPTG